MANFALMSDGLTIRVPGLVTNTREETNFKGWHKWIAFVMQSKKERNMVLNHEHSSEHLFIQTDQRYV